MKSFTRFLTIVAGSTPLALHAACQQPSAIEAPNGATASLEQILAAQADVKAYMTAMESYLACMNEDLAVDGDDAPAQFKSALTAMQSTAVAELETVAATFSRELQEFWNAHPELRGQLRTQPARQSR
jgi:hypothetical protein